MSSIPPVFEQHELLEVDTQFQEVDNMNSGRFIDIVETLCNNQKHVMSWIKIVHRDLKSLADRLDQFTSKYNERNPDPDSQVLVGPDELAAASRSGDSQGLESFVSVAVDGELKHLMLDKTARNAVIAAQVSREATRIVLTSLHGIKELRKMTRTGMTKRKSEPENTEEDPEYKTLPYETQLFVQEVWKKLFPLAVLSNPTAEQAADQHKTWILKVNSTISSVLQYYKDSYDDEGRIVRRDNKRKRLSDGTKDFDGGENKLQ